MAADGDRPLSKTYLQVMVIEAVIILALWLIGRFYS
jgi:hypothetical protein